MKTLQEYIEEGQQRIDAELDRSEREKKARADYQASRFAKIMELALAHLPEFMHPFANGEISRQSLDSDERGKPDFVLTVEMPEMGSLHFNFSLLPFRHAEEIKSVTEWGSYERGIEVIEWVVKTWNEGYYLYPQIVKSFMFDQLPEALVLAESYKNNPEQARTFCDAKNEAYQRKLEADQKNPPRRLPYCPLIQDECRGERCAWFVAWKSLDICAMQCLAYKAAEQMDAEL